MAGDDTTILKCQAQLLTFLNSCISQQRVTSYDLTYHGTTTRSTHRNLSNLLNFTDAMISVGFKVSSPACWIMTGDSDTQLANSDRPRVKVVDRFCFTTQRSLLSDTTQIIVP